MEIKIDKKTKFDVGDFVYCVDIYDKKIISGRIDSISLFYSTYINETVCTYNIEIGNNKCFGVTNEKDIYKTEYEAKIALGNIM